jgi:hypothetical protein
MTMTHYTICDGWHVATMPDGPHSLIDDPARELEQDLVGALDCLHHLEAILTNADPATRHDINTILNQSTLQYGFLIDQTQLVAAAIQRRLNNQ